MSTDAEVNVFLGTLIDASHGQSANIEKCVLGVQGEKIIFRENAEKLDTVLDEYGVNLKDIRVLENGEFLMPGFVDAHLHAPQFRFAGSKLDYQLLDWLEKYTYPTEAKFNNLEYAEDVFNRAVKDTLINGTTTASYFSTLHLDASLMLSEIVEKFGQRAFIGKVNMDVNCPDNYKETTNESIRNTEIFINKLQDKDNQLINPIVTPRFALNCSGQLLQKLGEMVKQYNVPVQSHLSENINECEQVLKLFPECTFYAEVYDKFNLLTPKTIMAHGIHLSQADVNVLKERGSSIIHCPNSNISLRSGLCDVRNLLKNGITVGLGTDIAGGYNPSILDAIRESVLTSKTLSITNENYDFLSYKEAFRLATLGGCQALGLENELGTLEKGKQFDALLININSGNTLKYFPRDSIEETIEKFFHFGDDRNIKHVFVAGKQLK